MANIFANKNHQWEKVKRSNRFSYLLNVDKEWASLMSYGRQFHKLVLREKNLLHKDGIQWMEETRLVPEDLVFRDEGVNTEKWLQLLLGCWRCCSRKWDLNRIVLFPECPKLECLPFGIRQMLKGRYASIKVTLNMFKIICWFASKWVPECEAYSKMNQTKVINAWWSKVRSNSYVK